MNRKGIFRQWNSARSNLADPCPTTALTKSFRALIERVSNSLRMLFPATDSLVSIPLAVLTEEIGDPQDGGADRAPTAATPRSSTGLAG
ncbi:hypothetical protein GCM10009838_25510 [Catenulispora subtropica]|uniref:Uncharacterized protein n=1 Tax=Catenulispora subtropica TaxID=450798 RepID=A0ABP5CNT0_9ACTN